MHMEFSNFLTLSCAIIKVIDKDNI